MTGREWRAGHKGMGGGLPQARDGAEGVSWALVRRNFQKRANAILFIYFLTSLLEYNCFTMVC